LFSRYIIIVKGISRNLVKLTDTKFSELNFYA